MPGGMPTLDDEDGVIWGPVEGGGASFPPLMEISRMTWREEKSFGLGTRANRMFVGNTS